MADWQGQTRQGGKVYICREISSLQGCWRFEGLDISNDADKRKYAELRKGYAKDAEEAREAEERKRRGRESAVSLSSQLSEGMCSLDRKRLDST